MFTLCSAIKSTIEYFFFLLIVAVKDIRCKLWREGWCIWWIGTQRLVWWLVKETTMLYHVKWDDQEADHSLHYLSSGFILLQRTDLNFLPFCSPSNTLGFYRMSQLAKSHGAYRDVTIRFTWFVLINGSLDMDHAPFADRPLKIKKHHWCPRSVRGKNPLSLYVVVSLWILVSISLCYFYL